MRARIRGLHVRRGKEKHQNTGQRSSDLAKLTGHMPAHRHPKTRKAERWEEPGLLFRLWPEVA